jgi:hypothetical protein
VAVTGSELDPEDDIVHVRATVRIPRMLHLDPLDEVLHHRVWLEHQGVIDEDTIFLRHRLV